MHNYIAIHLPFCASVVSSPSSSVDEFSGELSSCNISLIFDCVFYIITVPYMQAIVVYDHKHSYVVQNSLLITDQQAIYICIFILK